MVPLLLISSSVALALLVVHSWRTRGRSVTLKFFIAGTLFGLLRGNAIWYLCKLLGGNTETLKPYVPQGTLLPEIGHASIQVALGWVFSMYLAWTVAELILKRFDRFRGRVFMIGGVASLFMLTICYCMETTAVRVGWWYWQLATRSVLFGNVNVWGMEGWFSVVPDFLIPFMVIVCSTTRRRWLKWLWVLMFPVHLLGHLSFQWWSHAWLVYPAMELLVVVLAMFGRLRMTRGEIAEPDGGRTRVTHLLVGAALVIFFGVLATGDLMVGGMPDLLTLLPMVLLCLLAWRRVPVVVVVVLSLVGVGGWYWIGARALYAVVPVAVCGFLEVLERWNERVWLRLAPPTVHVALTLVALWVFQTDSERVRDYTSWWIAGDKLALAGRHAEAREAYARADRLRPHDLDRFFQSLERLANTRATDRRTSARLFQQRAPRLVSELKELIRRDPEWAEPRITLARFQLLLDDLPDAVEQYRQIIYHRPEHAETLTMLGYLLLREGKPAEAEDACVRAAQMRKPLPEALVNLGVIRFHQGRDEEARALWSRALERKPGFTPVLVNFERLETPTPNRDVDPRFLARKASHDVAVWVNEVAIYGTGYTLRERRRLWLEATQFDSDYLLPHMNLVDNVYLGGNRVLRDAARAVWHARRAVDIARTSQDDEKLPHCLLLLGRALVADGRQDEAREVLAEGRLLAPAKMHPEFDRLLERS